MDYTKRCAQGNGLEKNENKNKNFKYILKF
jgi:hypothetical protein